MGIKWDTWGYSGIYHIFYQQCLTWVRFFREQGNIPATFGDISRDIFHQYRDFWACLEIGGSQWRKWYLIFIYFQTKPYLGQVTFCSASCFASTKNTTTCRRIRIDEHKWPRSTGALLSWGASSHRCKQNQNCRGNHSFHRSMQIQHKQQKQWRWGNYTSHRYGNNSYAQ